MRNIYNYFKTLSVTCFLLLTSVLLKAQNVAINTTGTVANSSALLDLNTGNTFTAPNGKGLLIPNVALTGVNDKTTIPSPAQTLLVYNTNGGLSPAGYYYNSATAAAPVWLQLGASSGTNWLLAGNTATTYGTNYLGTNDDQSIMFKLNNQIAGRIEDASATQSTSLGYQALNANTGIKNTAMGYQALLANTTGTNNTAIGYQANVASAALTNATAIGNGATAPVSNSITLGNAAATKLYLPGYPNVGSIFYTSAATGLVSSLAPAANGTFLTLTAGVPTWTPLTAWSTTGNAGTTAGTNFIGTTDNKAFEFKTNNTFSGILDPVNQNAYFGTSAGNNAGTQNVAMGYQALASNPSNGNLNVAIGFEALQFNTTTTAANANTAVGAYALQTNTTGTNNTALGLIALGNSTTGAENTGVGTWALAINTTGDSNTALGWQALVGNDVGNSNTAIGSFAFGSNSGSQNTVVGANAMQFNNSGNGNTGLGYNLGSDNLASYEVFIGWQAGSTGAAPFNTGSQYNVSIGASAGQNNWGGHNCVYLGASADASVHQLTNAVAIGSGAIATNSNTVQLGNSSMKFIGINGAAYNAADAIVVGTGPTNGNMANLTVTGNWTSTSDSTKKRDIKNIGYGLSTVMHLRPVSYRWKGTDIHDIGFLAQEVKNVIPEIVYGEEGHMTLSYGQVTPVLVKAVQEQQHMIDSLKVANAELKSVVSELKTKVEANNKDLKAAQEKDQADIAELKKMVNSLMPVQVSAK